VFSSGKQNRGRQRLVRYLGAGSYRRFSPEKGKEVSVSAKTWLILVAIATVLLILAGVWQEARQLRQAAAGSAESPPATVRP